MLCMGSEHSRTTFMEGLEVVRGLYLSPIIQGLNDFKKITKNVPITSEQEPHPGGSDNWWSHIDRIVYCAPNRVKWVHSGQSATEIWFVLCKSVQQKVRGKHAVSNHQDSFPRRLHCILYGIECFAFCHCLDGTKWHRWGVDTRHYQYVKSMPLLLMTRVLARRIKDRGAWSYTLTKNKE